MVCRHFYDRTVRYVYSDVSVWRSRRGRGDRGSRFRLRLSVRLRFSVPFVRVSFFVRRHVFTSKIPRRFPGFAVPFRTVINYILTVYASTSQLNVGLGAQVTPRPRRRMIVARTYLPCGATHSRPQRNSLPQSRDSLCCAEARRLPPSIPSSRRLSPSCAGSQAYCSC
jgi:hypothetical protein